MIENNYKMLVEFFKLKKIYILRYTILYIINNIRFIDLDYIKK